VPRHSLKFIGDSRNGSPTGRPRSGDPGALDAYQLQVDTARHGIQGELDRLPAHVNLKAWWAKRMGMKRVGLGRAVRTAGLEWQGRAHRGIDDARMVAKLLPGVGWPGLAQGAAIRPGFAD